MTCEAMYPFNAPDSGAKRQPFRVAVHILATPASVRRPRTCSSSSMHLSPQAQKRDVFADVTSGSRTAVERPGMKKLLEYADEGDTVVVWRVDQLGRSFIDVLNTVTLFRERGILVRVSLGWHRSGDVDGSTDAQHARNPRGVRAGAHCRARKCRHHCRQVERHPIRASPL